MLKRLFTLTCILGVLFALSPTEVHAEDHMHYTCGEKSCSDFTHSSASVTQKTYSALSEPERKLTAGRYFLANDIILDQPLTTSGTVYLCLNGHSLSSSSDFGSVIIVEGTLHLCDCIGTGVITGGTDSGIFLNSTSDAVGFHMFGGTIKGNVGSNGGAIRANCSQNPVTIRIYGGQVVNNTANCHGGGIYAPGSCELTIYGGILSENAAAENGGAIYAGNDSLSLVNPAIKDNTAKYGGGIYVSEYTNFSISGTCAIQYNRADLGGGVYFAGKQFSLGSSENPVIHISQNVDTDVFLQNGKTICVEGIKGDTRPCIGISMETPDTFTTNWPTSMKAKRPSDYFYGNMNGIINSEKSANGILTIPEHIHTWSSEWTVNDTAHWHICTAANCPVTDVTKMDGYAKHTQNTVPGSAATCTQDGVTDGWSCDCGYTHPGERIPAKHDWKSEYSHNDTQHYIECSKCSETKDAADHVMSLKESGFAAKCGIEGKADLLACNCGYESGGNSIPALTHDWSDTLEYSPDGHWQTCTRCTAVTETISHTLTHTDGYDATCTKPGLTAGEYCPCGYTSGSERIEPNGHDWSTSWTQTETEHWHICNNCDEKQNLGDHDWQITEGTEPTCTVDGVSEKRTCSGCGYTIGGETLKAPGHNYSATADYNDTEHWYECSCGDKKGQTVHSFIEIPKVEASCTESGREAGKYCTECDYKAEGQLIQATHKLTDVPAQPASCTEPGHEAGTRCENCSYTTGLAEIPAPGHSWKSVLAHDAMSHWQVCSICDASGTAEDHITETIPAVPVSCTVPGREAGVKCTICSYEAAGAEIEAPGHKWSNTFAHDTERHWKTCSGCTEVTELSEHAMTPVAGKAPTCTESGMSDGSSCACGYSITTTPLPATGHSWTVTVSGASLIVSCGTCSEDGGSLTLTAPDSAAYNNHPHPVLVSNTLTVPHSAGNVSYTLEEDDLRIPLEVVPEDAGSYGAEIAVVIGDIPYKVSLLYSIAKAELSAVLSMESWTYGEAACSPALDDLPLSMVPTFTYLPEAPVNAGSYEVIASVPESVNYAALELRCSFEVFRANQAAPEIPAADGITSSSLVLSMVEGAQYSLDGIVWQNSPVFAGLSKNTEYTVYTRYPEDRNHTASPISEAQFRTLDTYTVRYDLNGGSGTKPADQVLDLGIEHTVAPQGDIRRTGYRFQGWEKIQTGNDLLYKAKWSYIYVPSTPSAPARPVTPVTPVIPTKPEPEPLPFLDVPEKEWYCDDVRFVLDEGLMIGTSADRFEPDLTVDRATAATVLYRLAKGTGAAFNPFTDVPEDTWYTQAVAWCAANKIVLGDGNGLFRPEEAVSRQEMALMLQRLADYLGKDTETTTDLSAFSDRDQTADWARTAMSWCVKAKLFFGSDKGLEPIGETSRCQLAALLNRFHSNIQ